MDFFIHSCREFAGLFSLASIMSRKHIWLLLSTTTTDEASRPPDRKYIWLHIAWRRGTAGLAARSARNLAGSGLCFILVFLEIHIQILCGPANYFLQYIL